jgi:hypothetical protein
MEPEHIYAHFIATAPPSACALALLILWCVAAAAAKHAFLGGSAKVRTVRAHSTNSYLQFAD